MKSLILLLLICICYKPMAQCPATDGSDLDLSSNAFTITGDCIVTSSLDIFTNAQIDIQESGSLTINFTSGATTYLQNGGSITLRGDGTAPDAEFTINGDFSTQNSFGDDPNLTINIGAVLTVTGNMIHGSTPVSSTPITFSIDGEANIGGELTFGDQSTLSGAGTINVNTSVQDDGVQDAGFTGDINVALPVDFLEFKATKSDYSIILEWMTASEINNSGFVIEKSVDGIQFYEIGFEVGKGTTNDQSKYRFEDYYIPDQITYYRLKQMDYDGKFEYSQIITINTFNKSNFIAYPTIVTNDIKIKSNNAEQFEAYIIDTYGTIQLSCSIPVSLEEFNYRISNLTPKLASGLYFIKIVTKTSNHTIKFIKQ